MATRWPPFFVRLAAPREPVDAVVKFAADHRSHQESPHLLGVRVTYVSSTASQDRPKSAILDTKALIRSATTGHPFPPFARIWVAIGLQNESRNPIHFLDDSGAEIQDRHMLAAPGLSQPALVSSSLPSATRADGRGGQLRYLLKRGTIPSSSTGCLDGSDPGKTPKMRISDTKLR